MVEGSALVLLSSLWVVQVRDVYMVCSIDDSVSVCGDGVNALQAVYFRSLSECKGRLLDAVLIQYDCSMYVDCPVDFTCETELLQGFDSSRL